MAYSVIALYNMMKTPDDENGKISQIPLQKCKLI